MSSSTSSSSATSSQRDSTTNLLPPHLDIFSELFDPHQALVVPWSSLYFPFPNIAPLDNLERCRPLLPPSDVEFRGIHAVSVKHIEKSNPTTAASATAVGVTPMPKTTGPNGNSSGIEAQSETKDHSTSLSLTDFPSLLNCRSAFDMMMGARSSRSSRRSFQSLSNGLKDGKSCWILIKQNVMSKTLKSKRKKDLSTEIPCLVGTLRSFDSRGNLVLSNVLEHNWKCSPDALDDLLAKQQQQGGKNQRKKDAFSLLSWFQSFPRRKPWEIVQSEPSREVSRRSTTDASWSQPSTLIMGRNILAMGMLPQQ